MIVELLIDNQRVDIDFADNFDFRLNKMIQSSTNFANKGGDTSTTLNIPRCKTNNAIFSKYNLQGINKFYSDAYYEAVVKSNGNQIFKGVFKLQKITNKAFVGELASNNIFWIDLLDGKSLNSLGYVDGEPTWFAEYNGGTTINAVNDLNNTQSDVLYPTIVYNNTPITDYLDFTNEDVYGTYNPDGSLLVSPKVFPDEFVTRNGYFGWRRGLTFEDFPPAVYYKNLIFKCFEEIGWSVNGNIFQEDWFNLIYLPYVGEGYLWNWKTLAHFFTELLTNSESAASYPFLLYFQNFFQKELGAPPSPNIAQFITPNIGIYDDTTTRIDSVANFKKLQTTDEYTSDFINGGYVAPTSGRYRITVKSRIQKSLFPDGVVAAATLDGIGGGNPDYGWDDNVLIISRRNGSGDFVFNDDFRDDLALWVTQVNNDFIGRPSDVVAYISPKRIPIFGTLDRQAVGSPLANWFNNDVQVNSSSHSIIVNNNFEKTSESIASITVDVDLLVNERLNFYWFSYMNQYDNNFSAILTAEYFMGGSSDEIIEIEYVCGYDDINIATNLPDIKCKDFISGFANYFNQSFDTNVNDKSVTFYSNKNYYSDVNEAIDITNRVDIQSIEITPTDAPKTLKIGYNNDEKDRLLLTESSECLEDTIGFSNYANISINENENIYAENDLNIKNGFSSTKFVQGIFEPVDTDDVSFTTFSGATFSPPQYYPITGETLLAGISFLPTSTPRDIQFPSIQSKISFSQTVLSDLEYDYNYYPRILYNLGTSTSYFGLPTGFKFRINSPQVSQLYDADVHWIRPTISAFDIENFNDPEYNLNSYRTLRFDGVNGIYNEYFEDIVTNFNRSHIVTCDAYLTANQWNNLNGSRLILLNGVLHKLLSVSDYDILGLQPCRIELLKII